MLKNQEMAESVFGGNIKSAILPHRRYYIAMDPDRGTRCVRDVNGTPNAKLPCEMDEMVEVVGRENFDLLA
jgi:hypothetical protein